MRDGRELSVSQLQVGCDVNVRSFVPNRVTVIRSRENCNAPSAMLDLVPGLFNFVGANDAV